MYFLSLSVIKIVVLYLITHVKGLDETEKRLSQLENILKAQKEELNSFRIESNHLKSQLKELQAEKTEELKLLKGELDALQAEKNEEIKLLKGELDALRAEKNEEIKLLKGELDDLRAETSNEITLKKNRLDMLEGDAQRNSRTDKDYVDSVTDVGNNVNGTANIIQKRLQASSNVAFYVFLSHHPKLGRHAALVFDVEVIDTGNNYNVYDGIFDVPVTGIYVFTVTVGTVHNGFVTVEIVVNGQIEGTAFANSEHSSDDHAATGLVVVHANAGDHVFVRKGEGSDNFPIISDMSFTRTTFCGWLLF